VRPKAATRAAAAAQVLAYARAEPPARARGIVYVLSREEADQLAAFLRAQGLAADAYHAGLAKPERQLVLQGWQRGDIAIVCATPL
jgi:superfamily II DNA helicase RecQ